MLGHWYFDNVTETFKSRHACSAAPATNRRKGGTVVPVWIVIFNYNCCFFTPATSRKHVSTQNVRDVYHIVFACVRVCTTTVIGENV